LNVLGIKIYYSDCKILYAREANSPWKDQKRICTMSRVSSSASYVGRNELHSALNQVKAIVAINASFIRTEGGNILPAVVIGLC
jgi:hypothetical protein